MRKTTTLAILLGFILAVWLAFSKYSSVSPLLIPTPRQVVNCFSEFQTELLQGSGSTFSNAFLGLGVSFLLAFLLAIVLTQNRFLKEIFYPLASFLQTIPLVAIAPLLVIWFGFGNPTVRASAGIVSFFPLLSNFILGFDSVSPAHLELLKIYQATRWQVLSKVVFPSGMPALLTGLKIGIGLAMIGAIVGEFIAGGGLGGLIDSAKTQQRTDLIFSCLIILSLVGYAFIFIIEFLEKTKFKKYYFKN